MSFFHAISIAGFAAGLLLQISLLASVLGKRDFSRGRRPLAVLLFAIALWQASNLGAMFLGEMLWRTRGFDVHEMPAHRIFVLAAGLGAFLIPPLVLHFFFSLNRQAAFAAEARRTGPTPQTAGGSFRTLAGDVGMFVFYLPVVVFVPLVAAFFIGDIPLAQKAAHLFKPEGLTGEGQFECAKLRFIIPIAAYYTAASVLATFLSYRCARKTRRLEDKLFFRTSFRTFLWADAFCGLLLASSAVLAFAYPDYRVEIVTIQALKLFTLAASIVPGAILVWFIYRYNYMSYRLSRRPLLLAAAAVAVIAYIFGFRSIAPFVEETLGIHFPVLEAAFLVVLVGLARPARRAIGALAHRLAAKREDIYRRKLARISEELNSPGIFTILQLFDYVAANLSKTFETQRVTIALFDRDRDGTPLPVAHATSARKRPIEVPTVLSFLHNRPSGYIDFSLARNPQLIDEMRSLRSQIILPLVRGGGVRGFISLGQRNSLWQYSPTEIEMIGLLASHLITAVENLALVDDKVQLRRKMLEGEKMLSLGRLSAGVAHEVKNPLSAIKTIAQVAREELAPDSRFYKDLTMIVSEIDRLSDVVEQLLRFARPAPRNSRAGAALILDDVVAVLKREATRRRVTLEADVSPELSRINLNIEAFKEILFNLILNGIQAMPEGGTLTVRAKCNGGDAPGAEPGPRVLRIEVSDTGPGVPAGIVERVFEPFFTTKDYGTGLGLAIVRERTEQMEGTVRIFNNGGATFIVELPLSGEHEGKPHTDTAGI